MRAVIGLGSNLGDREQHVRTAIDALQAPPRLQMVQVSTLYRTPPVGPGQQADYCNAVVEIDTTHEPTALLDLLQAMEQAHGRTPAAERRPGAWTARELDLDILLIEQCRLSVTRLRVPHPRLAERAFMLVPLADLGPGRIVPGQGRVGDLLAQVDCSGIRRWGDE